MGAAWAWARTELRRRRRASVGLLLLIGISGAVVVTVAAGARRTDSAFERRLDDTNTADVQVQYGSEADIDDDVEEALRSHPEIEVASPLYFTVAFSELSDYDLLLLSSPDRAQFRDVDRVDVRRGRSPDPTAVDEVLLTPFLQEQLHVDVGDRIELATATPEQFEAEDFDDGPQGPMLDVHVVGIGSLANTLADPTLGAIIATPAFFERYDGELGGFGPSFEVLTSGDRDPTAIAQEVMEPFEPDLKEVFFTPVTDLSDRVHDGTSVLVSGLLAFAFIAGLAFVITCAQALRRRAEATGGDQPILSAVGLTQRQRAAAVAMTLAPVVAGGVLLAVLLAIPGSITMPIGSARTAEPDPGIDIDAWVLGLGAVTAAVALIGVGTWSAVMVGRRRGDDRRALQAGSRRGALRLSRAKLPPAPHMGVTMALDPGAGPAPVPVRSALAGAALGIAGVVAVLTFGSSLDALLDEPARSGWNWTFAVEVPDDGARQELGEVAGVRDVGHVQYRQVELDGEATVGMAIEPTKGTPSFTILDGRMPTGPGEVAVGPELADRASVGIGDTVSAREGGDASRELVVVGRVLFPTFDDDSAFNDGIALAPQALEALGRSSGDDTTIVTFDPGVSSAEAQRRLDTAAPDALSAYSFAALPTDVLNLEGVRFLPRVLGVFLGALALAAIGHALATTVQRRRRELGTARSLGFTGSDLRRTVVAQAATLVVGGLVIGLPAGLVLGRTAWRLVAEGIGVAGTPTTPIAELAVLVPVALLLGALVAWLPSRTAARRPATDALRAE